MAKEYKIAVGYYVHAITYRTFHAESDAAAIERGKAEAAAVMNSRGIPDHVDESERWSGHIGYIDRLDENGQGEFVAEGVVFAERCPFPARFNIAADALPPSIIPATHPDTIDARRWRALMASQRLHFMGAAGIELRQKAGTEGRTTDNLIPMPRPGEAWHFGMEFWSEHPAHNDPKYPDQFERDLMVAYVDAMIAKQRS